MNTEQLTPVEWLLEQLDVDTNWVKEEVEQAIAMDKKALAIIRKFVNEFDEEGEVSWNTRDEAQNFLNNHKSE